uniref:50S ribosomal protein L22, chloroplastic n=1 Tax=Compsopogon caeruleus TaxID=31354 RepID=A0A1Z1XB36_9RHOD|nr:50S ribosomal protein L22 [Compsopogon caeruleus]ARX96081.1 50S ribosomal protein L22 [Compsopogon caeruleus]
MNIMINSDLSTKAISKYIRTSPNKVRRVLDQIRGLDYKKANMILEFMPYRCCSYILKTLKSARANAENNFKLNTKDLSKSFIYLK